MAQRLIDATPLENQLQYEACIQAGTPAGPGYGRALRLVKEAPTVEAAPVVHARWAGVQYDGYADGCPVYDTWECSNCRDEQESEGDPPPYNYCPNCGAKMDEEVQHETD